MKTILSANEIKDCLKVLDKIKFIKNKTPEILENILIQVTKSSVQLIKSNLEETTIKVDLKYFDTEVIGETIIPSDTVDLLKKLKDTAVTITDKDISTDNKNISFIHMDEEQYILPEDDNCEQIFIISQKELKRMLEVKYAMCKDMNIRPILYGVAFNGNETCALDGYRLSIRKGSYENTSEKEFVVNAGTIKILDNLLNIKSDNEVGVFYDDKKNIAKFKFNNIEIIGKCIEGAFIKYKQLIPEEHRYIAKVNTEQFKNELKFSLGKDKINLSEMTITDDNKLILKSKHANNTITSELKSENNVNNENEFTIAYNTMYMIDAINTYEDNNVILKMNSAVNPIVITNDDENLELVLPVRLSTVNR